MDFSITAATPEDVPSLLELIRELARFERLEHEVETTVESLREGLFGPLPAAGALLARSGSEIAGYALYFSTFCSFVGRPGLWLDDLYVRPPFRARGLGRQLLLAVARIALQRNCGRFEWIALNWNTTALDFYRKVGARALDEWVLLRMDDAGVRKFVGSVQPP
jgi:GNAT superfamily N-acetyltransferase